jgi:hypothetical protein
VLKRSTLKNFITTPLPSKDKNPGRTAVKSSDSKGSATFSPVLSNQKKSSFVGIPERRKSILSPEVDKKTNKVAERSLSPFSNTSDVKSTKAL